MSFQAMAWAVEQKLGKRHAHGKLLLLLMANYTNERGFCFPSYDRLAEDAGLARNSVIKWVGRLEGMGLISIKRSKSRTGRQVQNTYYMEMSKYISVSDDGDGDPKTESSICTRTDENRVQHLDSESGQPSPKNSDTESKKDPKPSPNAAPKPIREPIRESLNTRADARATDEGPSFDDIFQNWKAGAWGNVDKARKYFDGMSPVDRLAALENVDWYLGVLKDTGHDYTPGIYKYLVDAPWRHKGVADAVAADAKGGEPEKTDPPHEPKEFIAKTDPIYPALVEATGVTATFSSKRYGGAEGWIFLTSTIDKVRAAGADPPVEDAAE